jgi:hypothetical protein
MKRFCLALVLLLLVGSVHFAQDPKPAGEFDPSVKLMNLYRVKGRSWSHQVITWHRHSQPGVQISNGWVSEVEDGRAEVHSQIGGAGRGSVSSSVANHQLDDPNHKLRADAAKDAPEVELDLGWRKFRCKKVKLNMDGLQRTSWISTEFHPLVVKHVEMRENGTTIMNLQSFLEAPLDPWLVYRKQGRRWTQETSVRIGGKGSVSKMQFRVKEVRENSASWSVSMLDDSGKPTFSQGQEIQFTSGAIERDAAPVADLSMQLMSCPAGEFLCWYSKSSGVETWSSVYWPGVTVSMKAKEYSMELTEFDLGHDEQAFYRAQGNSYELTTTAGGSATKTRCEVTQFTETQATCRTTSFNSKGEEISAADSAHEVPDVPETLMAYAGQVEELVVTPAGSFPAIRTTDEKAGRTTWKWNGITVREVLQGPEGEMVTELTALNLQ